MALSEYRLVETPLSSVAASLSYSSEDSPTGKETTAMMPLNLTVLCVFLTFWSATSVFA
jgi:hypothetical protein